MDNPRTVSSFVGRSYELEELGREYQKKSSSLVVIYGRRRVGKTRLIEDFYRNKNLWRFDGIDRLAKGRQIKKILDELARITRDPVYASLNCRDWIDLFKIIDRAIAASSHKHRMTLFLDELPYMANRQSELVSALKWSWDNLWQNRPGFTLVLCGSIASFMVKKVVKSSALYGRISLEICLKPLAVPEVSAFFRHKKSMREICQLYMFCGGIPEYLQKINPEESVMQNMARLSFCKDGYFVGEFDRLFKDVFSEEMIYRKITRLLARHKNLKTPELTKMLNTSPGGGFAEHLENLELAGFVKSLVPWNSPEDTKLKRFQLDDEYLLFYFKFIQPHLRKIRENTSLQTALSFLTSRSYAVWAGFAFERLCLKHVPFLVRHLQIDQLVKDYGSYFNRQSNSKEGIQIDLLLVRHDPVITLCEIKHHTGLVGKWIIEEVEKKEALLGEQKKTIEKVLVTTEGVTRDLEDSHYFSRVVLIDELFGEIATSPVTH